MKVLVEKKYLRFGRALCSEFFPTNTGGLHPEYRGSVWLFDPALRYVITRYRQVPDCDIVFTDRLADEYYHLDRASRAETLTGEEANDLVQRWWKEWKEKYGRWSIDKIRTVEMDLRSMHGWHFYPHYS